MNDRQMQLPVTIAGLIAAVLGVIALGLAITCFFDQNFAAGFLSIHFAIGSALFRVRSWLCGMSRREQTAFEFGRESVLRRVP